MSRLPLEKVWQRPTHPESDLIKQLLLNRGLKSRQARREFLSPLPPESLFRKFCRNNQEFKIQINKAVRAIRKAITGKWPIIIYGDFDVDGLAATAILFETIYYFLGYKNVRPYIPNRFTQGYGLSPESLEDIVNQKGRPGTTRPKINSPLLMITVDCGITAFPVINDALSSGIETIVTDHHQPPAPAEMKKLKSLCPAVVWTDKLCGAGIAWLLAGALGAEDNLGLDLAALATVADLQALLGVNRSLVKYGLEEINQTKRPGLKALIEIAGLKDKKIGPYEVGWLLAPRLNAAGRLDTALDALRLLCVRNHRQAVVLAEQLDKLNRERQEILTASLKRAVSRVSPTADRKIIIAVHESYHEGIVGLVAGKLVQEFYRPALVIAKGEKDSRGSARSVSGVDIIGLLRQVGHLFEAVGGHPMAAGFSLKTEMIGRLEQELTALAEEKITADNLKPVLKIEAEVKLTDLNFDLWQKLQKFEPFGLGNPEPLFLCSHSGVLGTRILGREQNHLRLQLTDPKVSSNQSWDGIYFNGVESTGKLIPGDLVDLVFSLSENIWQDRRKLEIKIKDLRKSARP